MTHFQILELDMDSFMVLSLAWLGGKMCQHIKNKCCMNHGYELLDVDTGDQNTRDHETEASLNINQDLSV